MPGCQNLARLVAWRLRTIKRGLGSNRKRGPSENFGCRRPIWSSDRTMLLSRKDQLWICRSLRPPSKREFS